MVESVLARYRDITDGEMNELTTMLRRFAADQAREAARDYAAACMRLDCGPRPIDHNALNSLRV